jgi:hypothetical protein
MAGGTDGSDLPAPADGADDRVDDDADDRGAAGLAAGAVLAVLVGAALGVAAGTGAVALLVVTAAVQAILAFIWVFGLRLPGRIGALVSAALASGAADAAVSVWPHSRLGPLLAVLGLAIPALFVHQLSRGVARTRAVESLGGVALLVAAEVSLTALMQLRHQFAGSDVGSDVVVGVVVAAAAALAAACCTDLVLPVPRFDAGVPRGLPAVVVAAIVGGVAGHIVLHDSAEFIGGRGLFTGAGVGAVAALLAVGVGFADSATPLPPPGFGRRFRPALAVLVPLCVLSPVAYLLCLAVRA